MASQIMASVPTSRIERERLNIRIAPDCAVATMVREVDILLIGADKIAANGAVSNKIGSCGAAVCAKTLCNDVQVVVVSESDKIASPTEGIALVERHQPEEVTDAWKGAGIQNLEGMFDIYGEWFEWVEARWVDFYVTEVGVMQREDVERAATQIGELEREIFGSH
jgi:translation initiation factor 2B subunit (eIF-2B alpha/beta/delta family)